MFPILPRASDFAGNLAILFSALLKIFNDSLKLFSDSFSLDKK
jgi:hypothetical protein